MRLEFEDPEESQIVELEIEIDEARRIGDTDKVNSLTIDYLEIRKSWIARLDLEMDYARKTGKQDRVDSLTDRRERASKYDPSNVR